MINPKKIKNYTYQEAISTMKIEKTTSKTKDKKKTSEFDERKKMVFYENIRPLYCYDCGSEKIEPEDPKKLVDKTKPPFKRRYVWDVYNNEPVEIVLHKIRYKCKDCGTSFNLDDFYPAQIKYSPEYTNFIAQKMIDTGRSESEMAEMYHISETTVSKAINIYIEKFRNSNFKVYPCKTIYFHKFLYGSKQKPCCCVCGNSYSGESVKLLEVYEEYSEKIVEQFKKRIFSLGDVGVVYYDYDPSICMASKLSSVFYNATVIVKEDNFKNALDKIRESINSRNDANWKALYRHIEFLINTKQPNLEQEIENWINSMPKNFKSVFLQMNQFIKRPIYTKVFLEKVKKEGENIISKDETTLNNAYKELEEIRKKYKLTLGEKLLLWLRRFPEHLREIYEPFLSPILFCSNSFNNIHLKKGYQIDITPIEQKIEEFEKKRYDSHIMYIRLMISSKAIRKVIVNTDLDRYLSAQSEALLMYNTYGAVKKSNAPRVIYEIQPGDEFCCYVDVEKLLSEE